MARPDYYEILGVAYDAGEEEIKQTYRRLAREWHPDRRPGDPSSSARFRDIAQAYGVLSDAEERVRYDRARQFEARVGAAAAAAGGARLVQDILGGVSELASQVFRGGAARGTTGSARGRDLKYRLSVEFEEAARGVGKEVDLDKQILCSACEGSGADPDFAPVTCQTCGGQGTLRAHSGLLRLSRACHTCRGRGTVVTRVCIHCQGRGRVSGHVSFIVNVPAGVEDGAELRVVGEGEPGEGGGRPGDLYVAVTVEEHPFFRRRGADVVCEMPLAAPVAAVGGSVQVPTPDGSVSVRVPPGTQGGDQLRLRGKGLPRLHGAGRGDLLLMVKVETAVKLDPAARERLERLAADADPEAYPSASEFRRRVSLWNEAHGK